MRKYKVATANIKVGAQMLVPFLNLVHNPYHFTGTWIPLERSLTLAKQYNIEELLRPLINFTPEDKSPPLAPKHLVGSAAGRPPANSAAARRVAAAAAQELASTSSAPTRGSTRRAAVGSTHYSSGPNLTHASPNVRSDDDVSMRGSEDGSLSPGVISDATSTSPTPSPIEVAGRGSPGLSAYESGGEGGGTGGRARKRKAGNDNLSGHSRSAPGQHGRGNQGPHSDSGSEAGEPMDPREMYTEQILEYFISDTHQVPPIFISPPADFDPNMEIDDDGHSALHWASAMGRVRIVKLLLTAGADIYKTNKSGQTALMRSVMFANNYDVRKFPELYELLHRSTLNIDNYNRTVFHHIVDVAMSKGKTQAARYYMETILAKLAEYPKELADIINFQDEDGETALTMAARCRSKRLVKLLLDHGADPKIVNRDSKSTEDYILEDERFRSSPVLPSNTALLPYRSLHGAGIVPERPQLHYSVTAQKASTRCLNDMAMMMDSLASSFDQELRDKERDMAQAHSLLANIQSEILESQRTVAVLKTQAADLEEAEERLKKLEAEMKAKIEGKYRNGLKQWSAVDSHPDPAEQTVKDGETSALQSNSQTDDAAVPTDSSELIQTCETLRAEIEQQEKDRETQFNDMVKLLAESGTSGRMNQYRRLIGAGCGGMPPAEVDGVLGILLEVSSYVLEMNVNLMFFPPLDSRSGGAEHFVHVGASRNYK